MRPPMQHLIKRWFLLNFLHELLKLYKIWTQYGFGASCKFFWRNNSEEILFLLVYRSVVPTPMNVRDSSDAFIIFSIHHHQQYVMKQPVLWSPCLQRPLQSRSVVYTVLACWQVGIDLLTTCYKVVELNRLVTSCSNDLLSSCNSTIFQQVVSNNLVANW